MNTSTPNRSQPRWISMMQCPFWLLPPSRLKNRLLRLFGHHIATTARIGPSIVLRVKSVHVGEYARVELFNVLRGMSSVRLEDFAIIESWNWISAHPVYQRLDPDAGTLYMGFRAKLGSRNYLDCSGTIAIRPYGTVGGNRCLLQTHQPDFLHDRQAVGRVTVGRHASVGSCAVLLKGAFLPDRSILAANSTLTSATGKALRSGLYAGSPAVWKKELDGAWFHRHAYEMTEHVVDEPMGVTSEDALALDVPEQPTAEEVRNRTQFK
ncbi:hypothetical protein ACAG25_23240 [Mycobacterium sp. pV006]|uniref:hypothetical protein n=1 Tax=Mycobacterium sp. pV006 TaxID=3238983 RepID=UPI00351AE034